MKAAIDGFIRKLTSGLCLYISLSVSGAGYKRS